MTGSTLTALAANPAPSPEAGLISIRPLDASIRSLDVDLILSPVGRGKGEGSSC